MTPKAFVHRVLVEAIRRSPHFLYPLYSKYQSSLLRPYKLEKGIVCLSFDNDYREDNEAVETLLPLFREYGIPVTWAVVGRWVEQYLDLHKRMLADGHELMNHSWSHPDNPQLRPNDPRKFDAISKEEVEDEITKIHEFCLSRLNYRMCGFRMPHFRRHPAIAPTLRKLGYEYTSNHLSLGAPTFGAPYMTVEGWAELPLTGLPREPLRVFETYRLFRAPDGLYPQENVFYQDFCEILRYTEKHKLITCMYFDACDIVRLTSPTFSAFLERLKGSNVEVRTFGSAAQLIRVK